MALLIIYRTESDSSLQMKSFRFNEEWEEFKTADSSIQIELEINPISRGAIQQVERHFIRLLNESYLEKLKSDSSEVKKVLRLYEIGARR